MSSAVDAAARDPARVPAPSLAAFTLYFLRLGATGFGGPVALAHRIRKDLVERRGWLLESEYEDGFALAAACPGPLAYQLAVFCGYLRFGIEGGLAVAVGFAAAPFAIVTALAFAYARWGGSEELRSLFHGIAPVVLALIVRASFDLGRKTLRRDAPAWVLAAAACATTVALERELAALFLVAGFLGALVFRAPRTAVPERPPLARVGRGIAPAVGLPLASAAAAAHPTAGALFLFFFKTGLLVFGSGLVIVPFLKTYVVEQYGWLSHGQFMDAVAIGMMTPGPVVITATFVGYLLDGVRGAAAATAGIFMPAVLFTVLGARILARYRSSARLAGFVRGITAAVVGVLAGTTALVARTAVTDAAGAAIAAASLVVLALFRRVPEPALVAAGGLAGFLTHALLGAR